MPDPVLDAGFQQGNPDLWMSGPNANESVMMEVRNLGAFVRALLPVRLSGGYSVTFGVWVAINPREIRRVFDVWWAPEYEQLVLEGYIANDVMPWGLLGAPVTLRVRDVDQTPYCDSSDEGRLSHVLSAEWDHDEVLASLP